jgi:hypothetical protein
MNGTLAVIFLNQVAQGIRSVEEARQCYELEPDELRPVWTKEVGNMALQAGATPADAPLAADWAGVKRGAPAVVLFASGVPKVQLRKILALPRQEQSRTCMFLLGLLHVADARRREGVCRGTCSHWWHRDLRNETTVQELISSGEARGLFIVT